MNKKHILLLVLLALTAFSENAPPARAYVSVHIASPEEFDRSGVEVACNEIAPPCCAPGEQPRCAQRWYPEPCKESVSAGGNDHEIAAGSSAGRTE